MRRRDFLQALFSAGAAPIRDKVKAVNQVLFPEPAAPAETSLPGKAPVPLRLLYDKPASEWLEFYRPETVVAIGGLKPKVLSARILKTGQKVEFTQDEFTFRLTGMPLDAPDQPATVIEVQCDGEPVVDHSAMRPLWPRYKVGISI